MIYINFSSGSAGMVMMAVTDNHRIDLGYAKGPKRRYDNPFPYLIVSV